MLDVEVTVLARCPTPTIVVEPHHHHLAWHPLQVIFKQNVLLSVRCPKGCCRNAVGDVAPVHDDLGQGRDDSVVARDTKTDVSPRGAWPVVFRSVQRLSGDQARGL